MRGVMAIYRREMGAYLTGSTAFVFVAVFLLALGVFTWEIGRFFDTGRAGLEPFFQFHPWLWMVFLPAIAMGLWADERSRGTGELLLTLPLSVGEMVVGKFLAAWTIALAALALTTPIWWTVNYLGTPDNAAIALTYLVSALMAAAYVSLGAALSALTGNPVMAFILSISVAFVLTSAGLPVVLSGVIDLFGADAGRAVAQLSMLTHFEAAQRGVLELRAVVFYVGLTVMFLTLNGIWVAARRTGN